MNQRILSILDEVVTRLSAIPEIEKIYLFGSYAYGHPTENSDLDICLIVDNDTFNNHNYFNYLAEADLLISRYLYDNKLEYDLIACTESDLAVPPNGLIQDVKTKGELLYDRRCKGLCEVVGNSRERFEHRTILK